MSALLLLSILRVLGCLSLAIAHAHDPVCCICYSGLAATEAGHTVAQLKATNNSAKK